MKKKKNIRKKYARGNPVRGGLATREQETSKKKPIKTMGTTRVVAKKTKPVKKAVQPKPPVNGREMITGREELERNNQGLDNQIIEGGLIERLPGETGEQYRARTAGQFTPSNTQQTYTSIEEAAAAKAGLTLEEYKASRPQTSNNIQTNDVARTSQTSQAFQRSPTTGKGSDQMFIGRESDVQPQAAQPTSRGSGLRGAINTITNMAQTTQALSLIHI